ncbi:hypothetical protein [Caldisericum sp.]|uniref:hypothetical protein n=1 Tax=Caldisericum sp. TaxID=2499687 RepID=UPI003D11F934
MTIQQYLDEIKLRLLRFQVSSQFDDLKILTFLNQARQTITLQVIDIYPDLFVTSLKYNLKNIQTFDPLTNGLQDLNGNLITAYLIRLPAELYKPIEIWVFWETEDGITEWRQLRLVSKKEYYFTLKHSFNSTQTPTFVGTYWHSVEDGFYYLSFALPKTLVDSNPSKLEMDIYYYYIPMPLELYNDSISGPQVLPSIFDDEIIIPSFLEELVIQQTILYLLTTIDQANALQRCKDELEIFWNIINFNKEISNLRKRSLLPSKKNITASNLPVIGIEQSSSNGNQ